MELNIFSQQFKYNLAIFFTFSSISSILSGTIGIHYGHVLIHFKVIAENSAPTCMFFFKKKCSVLKKASDLQTHKGRLKHWLLMGFSLLVLGILLHFTKGIYPAYLLSDMAAIYNPWTQIVHVLLCSCSHPNQQAALQLQLCLLYWRGGRNRSLSFLYTSMVYVSFSTRNFFKFMLKKQINKYYCIHFLTDRLMSGAWGLRSCSWSGLAWTPCLCLSWEHREYWPRLWMDGTTSHQISLW